MLFAPNYGFLDACAFKCCTSCGQVKRLRCFSPSKRGSLGVNSVCKPCNCAAGLSWYRANREKALRLSREYYTTHKSDKLLSGMKWRCAHPEKVKAILQRHYKKAYATPEGKFLRLARNRVREALAGKRKFFGSKKLIGCSMSELIAHLQKQFVPGMTIENYGRMWHIDHRRPCASFDLSQPAQQLECFHWTNLQPLFVKDNLKKGAKII